MKSLLISFLLSVSTCLGAADLVELYTHADTCSIREIGNANKTNSITFEGERWSVGGIASGCRVTIGKEHFESMFSMCFLTGIDFKSEGGCSFGKRTHNGTEAYLFEFDDKKSVSCQFACENL
jgi:hypothetical protein